MKHVAGIPEGVSNCLDTGGTTMCISDGTTDAMANRRVEASIFSTRCWHPRGGQQLPCTPAAPPCASVIESPTPWRTAESKHQFLDTLLASPKGSATALPTS